MFAKQPAEGKHNPVIEGPSRRITVEPVTVPAPPQRIPNTEPKTEPRPDKSPEPVREPATARP